MCSFPMIGSDLFRFRVLHFETTWRSMFNMQAVRSMALDFIISNFHTVCRRLRITHCRTYGLDELSRCFFFSPTTVVQLLDISCCVWAVDMLLMIFFTNCNCFFGSERKVQWAQTEIVYPEDMNPRKTNQLVMMRISDRLYWGHQPALEQLDRSLLIEIMRGAIRWDKNDRMHLMRICTRICIYM